jgi:small subunit ribosomal protein S4
MARYRGPKSKIARRFRDPIFGADKALDRRNYGPGQHGPSKRRGGKQSEYAIQLIEKQKAKYTYGVLERQFAKTFGIAAKKRGITGENLLKLLESRLDNTVFRLGIAPTRSSARQLVSHNHILVNGEIVNIPSLLLKAGDTVAVREKSKKQVRIAEALSLAEQSGFPMWVSVDAKKMEGSLKSWPDRSDFNQEVNESLIVELYSR